MTRRTRRELKRAIDELEAATPSGGEYADPPDLTTAEKHELAELFDADVWDGDTVALDPSGVDT